MLKLGQLFAQQVVKSLRLLMVHFLQISLPFHNGSMRGVQITKISAETIIVGGQRPFTMFNRCHFGVGGSKLRT
jgi:hypothetical protein